MTATFALDGLHKPVVIVGPDDVTESILLAAFIRYDANVFSVSVERYDDGRIKTLTFSASDAT